MGRVPKLVEGAGSGTLSEVFGNEKAGTALGVLSVFSPTGSDVLTSPRNGAAHFVDGAGVVAGTGSDFFIFSNTDEPFGFDHEGGQEGIGATDSCIAGAKGTTSLSF